MAVESVDVLADWCEDELKGVRKRTNGGEDYNPSEIAIRGIRSVAYIPVLWVAWLVLWSVVDSAVYLVVT